MFTPHCNVHTCLPIYIFVEYTTVYKLQSLFMSFSSFNVNLLTVQTSRFFVFSQVLIHLCSPGMLQLPLPPNIRKSRPSCTNPCSILPRLMIIYSGTIPVSLMMLTPHHHHAMIVLSITTYIH